MPENHRIVKLPFMDGGKAVELPNLSDPDLNVDMNLEMLTIQFAVERYLKKQGIVPEGSIDEDLEYRQILSVHCNIRKVKYILKKLDPNVTDKQIEDYAKTHKGFYGELILRMYGTKEEYEDFQKAASPPKTEGQPKKK